MASAFENRLRRTIEMAGTDGQTGPVPVMATPSDQGIAVQAAFSDPDAVGAIAENAFNTPPYALRNSGYSWIWKSDATSGSTMINTWYFYVPVGRGYYNYFVFGNNFLYPAAADNWVLGRVGQARIGTYTRHDAPSGVTKVGSWTSVTPAVGVFQNGICRSTTPGDQVTFSVTGSDIVHRVWGITNAGCAIVAVDGDWTNGANRLPVFNAADFAAGRCRASDVGKRYMNLFFHTVVGDLHVPIASGLTDGPHTVTFEVTGTKCAPAQDVRCYIGGLVACSAANAADTPSSVRAFAHVEPTFDPITGPSAYPVVFEAEFASTPGSYEFRMGPHGGETNTSMKVIADGIDVTGTLAAGNYQAAIMTKVSIASTVATADAMGAPFATKTQDFFVGARGLMPCVCDTAIAFTSQKKVRSHYPAMMTLWAIRMDGTAGYMEQYRGRWESHRIGTWVSSGLPDTVAVHTNYANTPARMASVTGPHGNTAYVALLDGYESVKYFKNSYNAVFLQRKTTKEDKIYFERSCQQAIETFSIGDVAKSLVGWGISPPAI